MSEAEKVRYDILDESSWREVLVELTKAAHRAVPRWMLGEVEDLIQKAGIKLLAQVEKDETRRFVNRSYLWRVATTTVIDETRRLYRKMEQSFEEDGFVRATPATDSTPERWHHSRQVAEAVRDCLKTLSEDRRTAVGLYLLGDSVSSIAELLDWAVKRAKNLVYRGLADLRACLSAKGFEDEAR